MFFNESSALEFEDKNEIVPKDKIRDVISFELGNNNKLLYEFFKSQGHNLTLASIEQIIDGATYACLGAKEDLTYNQVKGTLIGVMQSAMKIAKIRLEKTSAFRDVGLEFSGIGDACKFVLSTNNLRYFTKVADKPSGIFAKFKDKPYNLVFECKKDGIQAYASLMQDKLYVVISGKDYFEYYIKVENQTCMTLIEKIIKIVKEVNPEDYELFKQTAVNFDRFES